VSQELPVLFPIHPRTWQKIRDFGINIQSEKGLRLFEPLGYLEFLYLLEHATVSITDSGGVQEETTYLGVPCLTVRDNTERPITVTMGTNVLVGRDMKRLQEEVSRILAGDGKEGTAPPLWDGKAAQRIADVIQS
jgi:UDP-N-acetylglucosamine 2-epimerase (non-hydrolysing)